MLLKVNTVISRALLPCQVSDYEQYGCYIILFIRLGQTIHLYLIKADKLQLWEYDMMVYIIFLVLFWILGLL